MATQTATRWELGAAPHGSVDVPSACTLSPGIAAKLKLFGEIAPHFLGPAVTNQQKRQAPAGNTQAPAKKTQPRRDDPAAAAAKKPLKKEGRSAQRKGADALKEKQLAFSKGDRVTMNQLRRALKEMDDGIENLKKRLNMLQQNASKLS